MTIAMCGAWRTAAVLAVLLSLATAARGGNSTQPESASCWDFGLGTQAGSSFSGGILGQLTTNGVVSGSAVYGVIHHCAHGILFPDTDGVKSVAYYLDDQTHSGTPTGTKSGLTPFKLSTAGLAAGQHYLTVVITFDDSAAYLPFVSTKSFRIPTTGTILKYKQCGGAGGSCGGTGKACKDAAWTGASCRSGLKCRRQSKYYYQCLA